jgi:hypothetical protein
MDLTIFPVAVVVKRIVTDASPAVAPQVNPPKLYASGLDAFDVDDREFIVIAET